MQRLTRQHASANPLEQYPCLRTLTRGALRLRVLHNGRNCGGLGCLVQLSLPQEDEWVEVALVSGEDLQDAVWLLRRAATFIEGIRDCVPEPESTGQ